MADVLHAEVVLVGEEVGEFVVFGVLAEHPGHGDRGLLERVGPVLGADARAEQRVLGRGDVADREDVGVAGAQRRVDQDTAVADRQAGAFGERDVGRRADRDQDGVGVDGGTVAELQPGRFAAGRW